MTGIIKTDQLQGAQSTTITIPTGNKISITDSATIGTLNATTMRGTTTFADSAVFSGAVSGITTGKVLQMVQSSSDADTRTLTASGDQELMNLAITPSAATSKILILAQSVIEVVTGSSGIISSKVYRGTIAGGTQVGNNPYYSGLLSQSSGHTHYITLSHSIVDAPSTTSATTYTLTFGRGSGGTTSVRSFSYGRHLTLLEIGA